MAAFARCTSHLTVRANSLASISAGRCAHLRSTGHLSSFNLAANSGSRVRSTVGSFLISITITLTKGLAGLNLCRLHGAHVSVLVESVRSLSATRYCLLGYLSARSCSFSCCNLAAGSRRRQIQLFRCRGQYARYKCRRPNKGQEGKRMKFSILHDTLLPRRSAAYIGT